MKFTLSAPFQSISGTVYRKKLPDGRIRALIATKNGTMYERIYTPRTVSRPE